MGFGTCEEQVSKRTGPKGTKQQWSREDLAFLCRPICIGIQQAILFTFGSFFSYMVHTPEISLSLHDHWLTVVTYGARGPQLPVAALVLARPVGGERTRQSLCLYCLIFLYLTCSRNYEIHRSTHLNHLPCTHINLKLSVLKLGDQILQTVSDAMSLPCRRETNFGTK